MNSASVLAPETTIAVIGAGRFGGVLARALKAAGFDVRGPLTRTDQVPEVGLAILTVPDAAIPEAAAAARGSAGVLVHVSGATGLGDVDLSIHPLQTFTGAEAPEVLHGIGAAVDGRTDEDRALAVDLARALGMTPFRVSDRAAYHAAASFASNFVLTVLDATEHLAQTSGVPEPRDLLAPLIRQSVDNWQERGAQSALTGPIVRGDIDTVARQREAAEREGLAALFDALAEATREVVGAERVSTRSLRSLAQRAEEGRSVGQRADGGERA